MVFPAQGSIFRSHYRVTLNTEKLERIVALGMLDKAGKRHAHFTALFTGNLYTDDYADIESKLNSSFVDLNNSTSLQVWTALLSYTAANQDMSK